MTNTLHQLLKAIFNSDHNLASIGDRFSLLSGPILSSLIAFFGKKTRTCSTFQNSCLNFSHLSPRGIMLLLPLLLGLTPTMAAEPPENIDDSTYVQSFNYSERIYSQSRGTEVGEQLKLNFDLRKNFSENSFLLLGIEIDPQESRLLPTGPSSTSVIEIRLNHRVADFEFQADFDLKTQTPDGAGISLGTDADSESSFISYAFNPLLKLSFYPYNFDGEVGSQFNTWDVTRLYFIDGAPTALSSVAADGITLRSKTIPGFMLAYTLFEGLELAVGGGAASFLYPANPDFDLLASNPTVTQWERREDIGYRGQINWSNPSYHLDLKYVGHNLSKETGSLLAEAASLNYEANLGSWFFASELVYSKAGDAPYSIGDSGQWFANIGPTFQPLYSDSNGAPHNWFGTTGGAGLLRIGRKWGKHLPYISFMHHSEHFVYRDVESAHRLRNNDGTLSHGGLLRVEIGVVLKAGPILVAPEIEWRQARNPVFTNSGDVTVDPKVGTYDTTDYLFSLNISYGFNQLPFSRWMTSDSTSEPAQKL